MEHERKWCTCDRCGAEIKKGRDISTTIAL